MPRLGEVLGEELRDVAHAGGQGRGGRVAVEEVAVLPHGGAAAGGVGDDPVHVADGLDVRPGEPPGRLPVTPVEVEGAAAALPLRDHHAEAGPGQEEDGRAVDLGEQDGLDTTRQEGDRAPTGAVRGGLAERSAVRHRTEHGNEALHRLEPGKPPEQPRPADEALEAGALVEPHETEHAGEASRLREHSEDQPAEEPAADGTRDLALDLATHLFEQPAEGHAGRACRLAGPATEAAVHVGDEVRSEPDAPLGGGPHQVDAAARRVHLLPEDPVGRTLGEADPAVDAVEDPLPDRRGERVEGAPRRGSGVGLGRLRRCHGLGPDHSVRSLRRSARG